MDLDPPCLFGDPGRPGDLVLTTTTVDPFWRYSPVLDARFSYRGEDVVAMVHLAGHKSLGYCTMLRLIFREQISLRTMPSLEQFNARLRAECLNAHWFRSLADTQRKLEDWRKYYNERARMARSGESPRLSC
jgi:putative transposase